MNKDLWYSTGLELYVELYLLKKKKKKEQAGIHLSLWPLNWQESCLNKNGCEGKRAEMQSMKNKRGATEQDGGVGKTEKITLLVSSPHRAWNQCWEGEKAADTNQVYWIFIAMLASWSMTLGSRT